MKVYERYDFMFPEDMKLIIDYLNARGEIRVKYSTLEELYEDFCSETLSAQWIPACDGSLREFEEWLNNIDL